MIHELSHCCSIFINEHIKVSLSANKLLILGGNYSVSREISAADSVELIRMAFPRRNVCSETSFK